MPTQPSLLVPEPFVIQPEAGRLEPRLWVRRLTIWSDASTRVRDIELRPGLNIIWSPDPADQAGDEKGDSLGHGSGKTLFCRLLRYCLGENRFAPDEQQQRVAESFREGWVSAEVLLDGEVWAILRPLGFGRTHYAVRGVTPESLFVDSPEPTGIEPLLDAIEQQIVTPAVTALMPGEHRFDAWRVALAWLTRDQECRFNHVTDWRSPDSDSGSPTRSMSVAKHLEALRALIGAIVTEELQLRAEIDASEDQHKTSTLDVTRRKWESDRLRSAIATTVGLAADDLPDGPLCIEILRKAATQKLGQLAKVDTAGDVNDLESLRTKHERQRDAVTEIEKNETRAKDRIPAIKEYLARLKSELPGVSAQVNRASTPICSICEVPIERVLAEGCKLSHKIPNLQEIRDRHTKLLEEISERTDLLKTTSAAAESASKDVVLARKERDLLATRVRVAQRLHDARSGAWLNTRQAIDDVKRLDVLLRELADARAQFDELAALIEDKRKQTGTFRDAQRTVFDRLSRYFDGVIREIVGPSAAGKLVLDGKGLGLTVDLGGDCTAAAISSLKVIAFDLAAMCMSIEGGTRLPAFLLHDSPREADMGLSVYHRIFAFIKKLESPGPVLFQYIVTTTTTPPDGVRVKPWLRDELHSSPPTERLLRQNL